MIVKIGEGNPLKVTPNVNIQKSLSEVSSMTSVVSGLGPLSKQLPPLLPSNQRGIKGEVGASQPILDVGQTLERRRDHAVPERQEETAKMKTTLALLLIASLIYFAYAVCFQ